MRHRMLPPGGNASTTTVVNGRSYTAALGSYVDAANGSDADELSANNWVATASHGSGTTAQRPSLRNGAYGVSMWFLDTTLGYIIVWDGAAWRNPVSGVAV